MVRLDIAVAGYWNRGTARDRPSEIGCQQTARLYRTMLHTTATLVRTQPVGVRGGRREARQAVAGVGG